MLTSDMQDEILKTSKKAMKDAYIKGVKEGVDMLYRSIDKHYDDTVRIDQVKFLAGKLIEVIEEEGEQ